jgi:hypothetical protein
VLLLLLSVLTTQHGASAHVDGDAAMSSAREEAEQGERECKGF